MTVFLVEIKMNDFAFVIDCQGASLLESPFSINNLPPSFPETGSAPVGGHIWEKGKEVGFVTGI